MDDASYSMDILVDLPAEEREQVAHRAGYGCARCGTTIYHYVHLPVEDGPQWLAPSVTLLCPPCYRLIASAQPGSKQYKAYLDHPIACEKGFDRRYLPYHAHLPTVIAAGDVPVTGTAIPVMLRGYGPVGFAPAATRDSALAITLQLSDAEGVQQHIIVSNQWTAPDDSWSFRRTRMCYVIECNASEARAELEFPSEGVLVIRHLRTVIEGTVVEITPEQLTIGGTVLTNVVASRQIVGFNA